MNETGYNFDSEKAHKCLTRYYESGNTKDFNVFVQSGARRFIECITRKRLRRFKKEIVEDLEKEAANMVLFRLMKSREKPIKNMKSYLYAAATNVSSDLIKKYKLYENQNMISFKEREYQIESPEYTVNQEGVMKAIYEKLLHYFTEKMKPKVMKPHQAYVLLEAAKGYSCKEIAKNMPERKLETIKSDLRDARRILRENHISKEDILEILRGNIR